MPQAGQIIRALDFPEAVEIRQAGTDSVTWTSFTETDPSCEGTFIAGTSGRVKFDLFVRISAGTSGDYIESSIEVREDDAAGTIVYTPTEQDAGIDYGPALTVNQNADGWVFLDELTPGRAYWVQMQHKVGSGDTVSMLEQVVLVVPLP